MEDRHCSIVIVHGGVWNNNTYDGGRKEYIPIPPTGITYDDLLGKAEVRLKKDRGIYMFDIDALVKSPDGEIMRMKVSDDFELSYLMGLTEVPTVYVDVCRKECESFGRILKKRKGEMANQFVDDIPGCEDDAMTDSNSDDNVYESGGNSNGGDDDYDDCREQSTVKPTGELNETNEDRRLWVVPGAAYQASIPHEEVVNDCNVHVGELVVGGMFFKKDDMTLAVGTFHMKNHLAFYTVRSNKERYHIVCKYNDTCEFCMRAMAVGKAWRIYEWSPHSCETDLRYHSHPTISSKVIATFFSPYLSEEGVVMRPRDIQGKLLRELGVNVKYQTALAGKNHALNSAYGDPDKSFQVIPRYLYMLEHLNPGTIVDIQTCEDDDSFQYCYFALEACVRAFRECRPVIVVDGTHLKGKYKGILFVAATKDGNEQVVPLAFGIGDKENESSWTWFLQHVRESFGCPRDFLIVSDQHLSIRNAVESVYPGIPHGLCTFHLQCNLKRWGDAVIDTFKLAANCYKKQDFDEHMRNLALAAPRAYAKIMSIDPSRWAVSCSPVRKFGFGTSNCVEVMNSRLKWNRKLPVCPLLESVRKLLQDWFYTRRTKANARTHELTVYAAEELANAVEDGRSMRVEPITDLKFKVSSGMKTYLVDIVARSCSCLRFDLDLIPCSHAAAAISHARQSHVAYVDAYYSTETWRKIYAGEVMPIPDPEEWRVPPDVASRVVRTPPNPRQAGRPRTKRIHSGPRSMRSRECSRCHQKGHYQNTCTRVVQISREDEVSSNQSKTFKARKPKKCGICGIVGHTRQTCQDPNRFV